MGYKTILAIVPDPDLSTSGLENAIACARREQAHLDVLCLGIDPLQPGYYYASASAILDREALEQAREKADAAEAAVAQRLSGETLPWGSDSIVTQISGLNAAVARHARFCDLAVLPRPYGDQADPTREIITEAVLFSGQSPALITNGDIAPPERIVLAWNQSDEALRATRAALPWLKQAASVNIAIVDPPRHGPDRSDPGGALSRMLARHGVSVEISVLSKTMPRISDVLCRHAQDVNADLIVMGAYGRSRFSEAIFGGATRNMLEVAELPVLLAH